MADQWYYTRNGQKTGPVSLEQIRGIAASGGLQPTDLVWKNGMAEWTSAANVQSIYSPKPRQMGSYEPLQDLPAKVVEFWHKYSEHPLFVAALLIMCFPVGLYLIWRHSRWTSKQKLGWAGAWALVMLLAIASSRNENEKMKGGVPGDTGQKLSPTNEPVRLLERKAASATAASDESLEAARLVADYDANEVRADQVYKGKNLVVTGVVAEVKKDILGTMYVALKTNHPIRRVQCFFEGQDEEKVAGLSKGRRVKLKGTCEGLMMNVILKQCEIVAD